jgi:hypothetical protein
MTLRPKDLGNRWHVALVRYRALGTARIQEPPRLGRLGRLWSSGLDVPEETLAATLPLMADHTTPLVWGLGSASALAGVALFLLGGPSALPVALAVVLVGLFLAVYLLPRRVVRRFHTAPVEVDELEVLKGSDVKARVEEDEKPVGFTRALQPLRTLSRLFDSVRGVQPTRRTPGLEQEFLALAQEVVELQSVSPEGEASLRDVLRKLGEAVGRVPAGDARESDDVYDILGDAEMLAARAQREKDSVAAASLLRQAEALFARAAATEQNKKTARRVRVLRDELTAQVKMVRSLLPALRGEAVATTTELDRFTRVSETVQGIASEANSVAAAREELSQTLWGAEDAAEARTVRVGVGRQ